MPVAGAAGQGEQGDVADERGAPRARGDRGSPTGVRSSLGAIMSSGSGGEPGEPPAKRSTE